MVSSLMSFRTAWLRAVAHAWVDKSFKARLLKEPMKTLGELGFDWSWPGILQLTVSEGTGFQWIGDAWMWPSNTELKESLTLHVPLRPPENVAPEEHAIALADYYAIRPSLLGGTNASDSASVLAQLDCSFRTTPAIASEFGHAQPTVFSSQQQPTKGFIPSEIEFFNFEVALVAVMAKAWENENFRSLVEQDDDATEVLSICHGYVPPWSLTLRIRHDKTAQWTAPKAKGKSGKQNRTWSKLTPHVLTLNLPESPRDPRECGLALAAYNSTGAEFPFTCCV